MKGRAVARVLAGLALLAGAGAGDLRAESYEDLVRASVRGDVIAADRLATWPRSDLQLQLKWLREMRACAQCGERALADRFPFLGAVLLHTDRAFRDDEAARTESRDFHLDFALDLLEAAPPAVRQFEPAWFLVVGDHFLQFIETPEARRYFAAGLSRFPGDVRLRIGEGAAFEAEARLTPLPDIVYSGGSPTRVLLEDASARRSLFVQAESAFRRAAELAPESAEARLRRGHVLIDLGKQEEARRELAWVQDHVPAGDLHSLAALFLGRADEKAGRWESAATQFREAARTGPPGARAAYVALAHALDRLGRAPEAQEVVDSLLARPTRDDPFDGYIVGPADEKERLVAEMQAAARASAAP